MNISKAILPLLSIGLFLSCKKPNPTYEVTYSKFKINQISLTAIPMTDAGGSNWDIGISGYQNPDVFLNIEDSAGNIIHDGTADVRNDLQSSAFPVLYTFSTLIPIEDLAVTKYISVNDDDSPLSTDDLIGKVPLKLADYKSGYPTSITLTSSGITIVVSGTWY
jgi:hypothetical protein